MAADASGRLAVSVSPVFHLRLSSNSVPPAADDRKLDRDKGYRHGTCRFAGLVIPPVALWAGESLQDLNQGNIV